MSIVFESEDARLRYDLTSAAIAMKEAASRLPDGFPMLYKQLMVAAGRAEAAASQSLVGCSNGG